VVRVLLIGRTRVFNPGVDRLGVWPLCPKKNFHTMLSVYFGRNEILTSINVFKIDFAMKSEHMFRLFIIPFFIYFVYGTEKPQISRKHAAVSFLRRISTQKPCFNVNHYEYTLIIKKNYDCIPANLSLMPFKSFRALLSWFKPVLTPSS